MAFDWTTIGLNFFPISDVRSVECFAEYPNLQVIYFPTVTPIVLICRSQKYSTKMNGYLVLAVLCAAVTICAAQEERIDILGSLGGITDVSFFSPDMTHGYG